MRARVRACAHCSEGQKHFMLRGCDFIMKGITECTFASVRPHAVPTRVRVQDSQMTQHIPAQRGFVPSRQAFGTKLMGKGQCTGTVYRCTLQVVRYGIIFCARGSINQDRVDTRSLQLLCCKVESLPFELTYLMVSFMLGHLMTCSTRLGLLPHEVLQDVEKVCERCITRQERIELGAKFPREVA